MDQVQMHELIASVYDAALEPEKWPATLCGIGDAVGAPATTIAMFDGAGGCRSILASGIPDEYARRFVAEAGAKGTAIAEMTLRIPLGTPFFLSSVIGLREWIASPVYQEMYRPLDLFHPCGVVLARSTEHNVGLSVQLAEEKTKFDDVGHTVLKALIPHVRRALSVFVRLDRLSDTNRILAEAVDLVTSAGVVLVDAAGSVILANRTAEAIARERDGFAIGRDGVRAARPDVTQQLQRAIAAAVRTAAGDTLQIGGTVLLPRPSGRRSLLAIASPAGAAEWELIRSRPAAILLISDPERQPVLPTERLMHLFGLTRREGQIAALLAQGLHPAEAADHLGISRATVHTHLKRILEKTDTHRQAELVSVLLRGLAGIGRQTHAPD